jgi:hypothetical protein
VYQEIQTISDSIRGFLKEQTRDRCIILGFDRDRDGVDEIIARALRPFSDECLTFSLDLDLLSWSPLHFWQSWLSLVPRVRTLCGLSETEKISESTAEPGDSLVEDDQSFPESDLSRILTGPFSFFEAAAIKLQRKIILILTQVHQLQTLHHYQGFQNTYEIIGQAIDRCPHLLVLLEGRGPFRNERDYRKFVDLSGPVIQLAPLTLAELSLLLKERKHDLSPRMLDFCWTWSGGFPGYLPYLEPFYARRIVEGSDRTFEVMQETMLEHLSQPRSLLFLYCQNRYFLSIERAKGFGSLRIILSLLARHHNFNLTEIARKIGKTPPAVKDYCDSLLEIGLVIRRQKTYQIAEPLLARWLLIQELSDACLVFPPPPRLRPESVPIVPTPNDAVRPSRERNVPAPRGKKIIKRTDFLPEFD